MYRRQNLPVALSIQQQLVLDAFYRGHLPAGQLTSRLNDCAPSTPAPSASRRPNARHRRAA